MKKIFSLLVVALATMTLSAQTFKVTWNLDGGCTNPQCATNKAELFNAFMTDCGLMSKLEAAGVTYDSLLNYVKLNPDNPCKNDGIGKFMTNTNALSMPQWAWLKTYIISVRGEEPAAGATTNYEVGAFWMSCQNTTWPKSSDYTVKGTDAAYMPAMNAAGQYYAYPTEVAADYVLPTPLKAGHTFLGWYDGETKVEKVSADVALTAKWDVTKFNVTWNLDGGCANLMCATNKAELFNAFMADCGLTSKLEANGATYESLLQYAKNNPADPCKNEGIGAYMSNANALGMPQWAWLKEYLNKTKGSDIGALTGAVARYEVAAFWMSCQNKSYPASSDYTVAGTDAEYVPAMNAAGIYYELPAQYTMVQELPTPFKAEYNFLGWYNGSTKVEHVDADMALTAKWERVIYNVAFVAPFAYPNDMYVDDVYELAYALQKDYNAAYNASKAWAKMEDGQVYYNIANEWKTPAEAQGQATTITGFIQNSTYNTNNNLKTLLEKEGSKWAWVKAAIKASRTASELSVEDADMVENVYRKEISSMFLASPADGGWPKSSDWTKYNAEAIAKAWGGIVSLPDTIAEDYTLPAMYRENYEFKGWYWNEDFSGDEIKVVPVKSNGTLYAKFEATDKALLGIAFDKKDTVELQMPATDQLTVIYTPETAANKKVVWSSSDEEVLIVDQNGLVTPKKPGKATIKIVSDESKLEASVVYNITAAPGAVTGITLDQTKVTLDMGKTIQLVATIAPEDAINKKITWTSDSKAASVDENGLVKADTVGTATITATTEDGGYTATCVITVPEPLDEIVVEKLWEVAIPATVANIGDVRNGMGWNGKFYLTDKNKQQVRVFSKNGEDADAAIDIKLPDTSVEKMVAQYDTTKNEEGTIVKIDTTYNKVTEQVSHTLGTGIAIDDAGNIVLGTNFPNSVVSVAIIKQGEKSAKVIDLALPKTGRCDQINAFGDIFSEQGGFVFFYISGATQLQYAKIAKGELVEVKAMEGKVFAGASPSQVLYGSETKAVANARGGASMQIVENGVVTDIMPKGAITNDLGGAVFSIGENEVWAYKVGTVHSSEFSVRNMTTQQFAADKDGNTVHYFIDNKAAANNSYANFTKAEKINDYAYYLNVFTSGKGAAVYKVYKNIPVESIILDKTAETVKAGDKLQLTATIAPAYATIQDVEWSTSDSAIAIVDQAGLVQAIAAGEATITATTKDGNHTATCTLTVKAVLYKKATSVEQLIAGKKMLIVNGDSITMAEARTNNFGSVAVTPNEDGVIDNVPAEATVITLEKDSVFSFAIDGGYITATTASSNYLRVAKERSSLTGWDITIAEDGVAGIVCHDAESQRNTIRFNENKGNPIFAAYKPENTQKDVTIYIEFEPVTYNVTVPAGTNMCYIVGAMTDTWKQFVEMDMVDATHYTITLDNAAKTDEYKYTCGPDWKYVEKNADGSERANRTWSEQDVVEAWAEIYDAVEDVRIDANTIEKVIIDGNLYIIRGGKMYNANGAVVR